ncbi:MAG: alkaline phosphatase family protein, partial [Candidatus Thorarchaeota archaeon]
FSNSIVNLMSSIGLASGVASPYTPLESLDSLKKSKNIVLIVFDGLGYNYLQRYGKGTILQKNLKGSITSVFPPSTGSAITTFLTGLAPQQHAVTGWYVHLKEYGLVSRILPFTNAINGTPIGVPISNVIDVKSIFADTKREYSIIYDDQIVESAYTMNLAGPARRIGYSDIDTFFDRIRTTIFKTKTKSYIYSYWPMLDTISHFLGCESVEAKEHLKEFDVKLQEFIEYLSDTNTTLIITADHGFSDVPLENIIYTRDHPKLMDCLCLPVCGDTRTGFCYVRKSKVSAFEKYMAEDLSGMCDVYVSEDLIKDGWFGLLKPHPRLGDRVGDYSIMFNEGYAIINCFPGLEPPQMLGHHGGVSQDELYVPLVIVEL